MSFGGGGSPVGVTAHNHTNAAGEGGNGPLWIGLVLG